MFASFNMNRFIDLFIDEAKEILESIEKLLLEIEQNGTGTTEQINDLFRYLHTLKGNSSSIGFQYFSKLAHQLENFLDSIRQNRFSLSSQAIGVLIEGYELLNTVLTYEIDKTADETLFRNFCTPFIANLETLGKTLESERNNPEPPPQDSKVAENERFGFFIDPQENSDSAPPVIAKEATTPNTHLIKDTHAIAAASIRVNLEKIDSLMNGIGELVIAMSMLEEYAEVISDSKLKNGFSERIGFLRQTVRDLQDSVMSTRMVPMEQVYAKFPKTVRDLAKNLNKEIYFKTTGNDVEIDKAMIEGLTDPLMHIIRNACDHGIEAPHERLKAGKGTEGTIAIEATQANEQIFIHIRDDGKGIDPEKIVQKAIQVGLITEERGRLLSDKEKISLIFEPGFTTAQTITDISGRGVGMDVVRSNINQLGGTIHIESVPGEGSTFSLMLPLTLAIVDVLTVSIGSSHFFLPLSVIVESLQPDTAMIQSMGNHRNEALILREEIIPVIRLHELFSIPSPITDLTDGILIITRYGTAKVALFVDMFANQQQVVIKAIDKHFKSIDGFSGASIRGDGSIGLILDAGAIVKMHQRIKGAS